MREFLSRQRIPFVVRQVDEDAGAYDELLARGFRSIPVTCYGGESVKGFDSSALCELVALAREKTGPCNEP